MKATEFVLTPRGVRVKKCCASCKHKGYGKTGDRVCTKGEGSVVKNYVCEQWEMNETYRTLRLTGDGRVKKPSYIAWMADQAAEITKSPVLDEKAKKELIGALPEKYEQQFGTKYLTK